MRFGINTFLFTSPFTNEGTKLFQDFKDWGFDSVEIALEDAAHIDPVYVKAELDRHGLVCGSLCGAFGPDRDLRGTPEAQEASIAYIKSLLDVMDALDCPTLVGPVYSAVGRAELVPDDERETQWQLVRENLQTVCRYAEAKGKTIALEPLNRFETDFINTCAQAVKMIQEVGSPALQIHLDTFHMNIEEKNPAAAIRYAGALLGHFHACGSDRGTPGSDHINWPEIITALREIGYDKDVVIESFTPDVQVIARAAAIWRAMEPSKNDVAVNGIKFLRQAFA
jgi:D-psicose/D-tagatose/L-ribulose 3-epimerase